MLIKFIEQISIMIEQKKKRTDELLKYYLVRYIKKAKDNGKISISLGERSRDDSGRYKFYPDFTKEDYGKIMDYLKSEIGDPTNEKIFEYKKRGITVIQNKDGDTIRAFKTRQIKNADVNLYENIFMRIMIRSELEIDDKDKDYKYPKKRNIHTFSLSNLRIMLIDSSWKRKDRKYVQSYRIEIEIDIEKTIDTDKKIDDTVKTLYSTFSNTEKIINN